VATCRPQCPPLRALVFLGCVRGIACCLVPVVFEKATMTLPHIGDTRCQRWSRFLSRLQVTEIMILVGSSWLTLITALFAEGTCDCWALNKFDEESEVMDIWWDVVHPCASHTCFAKLNLSLLKVLASFLLRVRHPCPCFVKVSVQDLVMQSMGIQPIHSNLLNELENSLIQSVGSVGLCWTRCQWLENSNASDFMMSNWLSSILRPEEKIQLRERVGKSEQKSIKSRQPMRICEN